MSMAPMYRKCLKCGQVYSYNPSVGDCRCPYCMGKNVINILGQLFDGAIKRK